MTGSPGQEFTPWYARIGELITVASAIDEHLNVFIYAYFAYGSGRNRDEPWRAMMNTIGMNRKIRFVKVIGIHECVSKDPNFEQLLDDLDELTKIRNLFAHSVPAVDMDARLGEGESGRAPIDALLEAYRLKEQDRRGRERLEQIDD